jgi:hypothetical protein
MYGKGRRKQKTKENGINGVEHTVDHDGGGLPRLPRFLTCLFVPAGILCSIDLDFKRQVDYTITI